MHGQEFFWYTSLGIQVVVCVDTVLDGHDVLCDASDQIGYGVIRYRSSAKSNYWHVKVGVPQAPWMPCDMICILQCTFLLQQTLFSQSKEAPVHSPSTAYYGSNSSDNTSYKTAGTVAKATASFELPLLPSHGVQAAAEAYDGIDNSYSKANSLPNFVFTAYLGSHIVKEKTYLPPRRTSSAFCGN